MKYIVMVKMTHIFMFQDPPVLTQWSPLLEYLNILEQEKKAKIMFLKII